MCSTMCQECNNLHLYFNVAHNVQNEWLYCSLKNTSFFVLAFEALLLWYLILKNIDIVIPLLVTLCMWRNL